MPSDIQTFPQGLTSLLRIYGGETPRQLLDEVRAAVDMAPFYVARNFEQVTAAGNLTNGGDFLSIDVPDREYWWVRNVSGVSICLAADNVRHFVGYRIAPVGNTQVLGHYDERNPLGAGDYRSHWTATYPFVLGPGGQLRFQLVRDFAAARSCSLDCDIVRLPF